MSVFVITAKCGNFGEPVTDTVVAAATRAQADYAVATLKGWLLWVWGNYGGPDTFSLEQEKYDYDVKNLPRPPFGAWDWERWEFLQIKNTIEFIVTEVAMVPA